MSALSLIAFLFLSRNYTLEKKEVLRNYLITEKFSYNDSFSYGKSIQNFDNTKKLPLK